MKSYKITGETNGWIAQRDTRFNGKTQIVIDEGMTLKEAQRCLLDLFNENYNACYPNWGLVRCNNHNISTSHADGTRSFEYDGRYFTIEEEIYGNKD